jgi:hypothetical protein
MSCRFELRETTMRHRFLIPCLAAVLGPACIEALPPTALPEPPARAEAPAVPAAAAQPASPEPETLAAQAPAGCELNLGGHYRARDDAHYRYRIEDDGTRVSVFREGPDADGSAPMTLERGPEGLKGSVQGEATTAGGKRCPVGFEAKVVSCRGGEIVIHSVDAISIDESCKPMATVQSSEKTLVRDPTAGGEKKAP